MKVKRAIFWALAVLIAAPILLIVGLVVFSLAMNTMTNWRFGSHESNRKIETIIAGKAEAQDVSGLFVAGTTLEELDQQLRRTGFDCRTETSQRTAGEKVLVCRGKIVKEAFCTHSVFLVAEFNTKSILRSVLASNDKNC